MAKQGFYFYKRVALSLTGLVTLGAAIAASAFSMSWFTNRNYIQKDITGSVAGAYFAYGDGSKENPYGINRPRHLYNLAWLQYMGVFNEDEDKDGAIDKQYYFEIDKSISILDMSGWVTPPIGTETYPFVGNFNGNGVVVSGLTVSTNQDNFTSEPNKVVENGFNAPSIIGFFGVVGKLPESDYSFDLETNSIYDLYLDKITIQNSSSTTNVLAGLLAGYVNGVINKCGVYRGKFDFVNGTTNIADSFDNVSDYSLIGSYDSDNYAWTDIPGGGGQENDFGGSIDFATFDKRISYVIGGQSTKGYQQYSNANMNAYVYTNVSNSYWNTDKVIENVNLCDGTYMPLNIDKTKLTTNSNGLVSYEATDGEPILNTNTGYIVGYKTAGSASPRISHSTVPYSSSNNRAEYSIASFPTCTNVEETTLFDSSNYSFLYYDTTDKNIYRLKDNDNSSNITNFKEYSSVKNVDTDITFQKYDSVKKDFLETLKSGTSDSMIKKGKIDFHGLMINTGSNDKISTYGTLSANNVTIDKNVYSKYALHKNGINFTLQKPGFMTMVVGAYRTITTTSKDGFYTLYEVNRSSDKSTIDSDTKIEKIYKSENTYEYDPSDTAGKTLIFDFSSLNNGQYLDNKGLYYFEFPLTAGEYFLTEEGNKNSPYILYLDIGANASSEDPGSEKTSIIEDIDFVLSTDNNYTGIVKINADEYVASDVLFKISGTGTAQGVFYFMRSSSGVVIYYINAAGLSIDVISSEGSANASKSDDPPWTTA